MTMTAEELRALRAQLRAICAGANNALHELRGVTASTLLEFDSLRAPLAGTLHDLEEARKTVLSAAHSFARAQGRNPAFTVDDRGHRKPRS